MTQSRAENVLALDGPRGVREAAQTAADVLAALASPANLLLDCAGLTGADLSLVQIILAAHRSAGARGSRVALAAPPPPALRRALEQGGFAACDSPDPGAWAPAGYAQ